MALWCGLQGFGVSGSAFCHKGVDCVTLMVTRPLRATEALQSRRRPGCGSWAAFDFDSSGFYPRANRYIGEEIQTNISQHLSICLSVCLSICLSVYLSICLSVHLSICLSIYLPIYLGVKIRRSTKGGVELRALRV